MSIIEKNIPDIAENNRVRSADDKPLIIVADSSNRLREQMEEGLSINGFSAVTSGSWENAREMTTGFKPELIVVDNTGFPVSIEEVRELNVPFILMANTDHFLESAVSADEIIRARNLGLDYFSLTGDNGASPRQIDESLAVRTALEGGADFFLPKPVDPIFLSAHIRASLRKLESEEDQQIDGDSLYIDVNGRLVKGDLEEVLTVQEARLIKVLLRHRGKVTPVEDLLTETWGSSYADDWQFARVWVSRLRGKLKLIGEDPNMVRTLHGIGYMFVPKELKELEEEGLPIEPIVYPEETVHEADKRTKIMAVDRDGSTLNIYRYSLPEDKYRLRTAFSREEAEDAMQHFTPNLLLLGDGFIHVPNSDGKSASWFGVTRNPYAHPFILNEGASYSLEKPVRPDVLMAYLHAYERRPEHRNAPMIINTENGVAIDLARRSVTKNGENIQLTRMEWKVLNVLAQNPNSVILNEEILTQVWGPDYRDDLQYLRVWVSRLRNKLGPNDEGFIISHNGIGYRLPSIMRVNV